MTSRRPGNLQKNENIYTTDPERLAELTLDNLEAGHQSRDAACHSESPSSVSVAMPSLDGRIYKVSFSEDW
jgi:hypothetical protein